MKNILITLARSYGKNSLLDTMRSREAYEFVGIAINKFKATKSKVNKESVYILSHYITKETRPIETLK